MKLIKISSVWCPSCIIMQSRYQEIANEYNLEIEEFDYDMDTEIVEKYQIGDILPVAIVLKDDKEINRIIGEKSKKELVKIIEDLGE